MNTKLPLPALRAINWLAFAFLVTMTGLALWLPLGGKTVQDLHNLYPNLFTPAPFTFAAWGVICLGQLLFLLHQSGSRSRDGDDALPLRLGLWPAVVNALGGVWLILWHHRWPLAALAVLAATLVALIAVYRRIGEPSGKRARWLTLLPFRLYLGWVSVSVIATTAAVLVHAGFTGWGLPEDVWAALLVAFATVLGAAMLMRHRDFAFAAVIAWALLGIFIRHTLALDGVYSSVVLTSLLGLMAMVGGIAYTYFQGKRWGCG